MPRESFGPPVTPNLNPRRFPIPSGRRPPVRDCDALEKGSTIPFPGRSYPCDFTFNRDEEILDRVGVADLMVPDDAAPPPNRRRYRPAHEVLVEPDHFGPLLNPQAPGVVRVTVPAGYLAYDAHFYATIRDPAWSSIVDFALYVNNKRVGIIWTGLMQEPVYVPIMGRANEGSLISLRARVRTTAGVLIPRDQITAQGELHVRIMAQTEACAGGLQCEE